MEPHVKTEEDLIPWTLENVIKRINENGKNKYIPRNGLLRVFAPGCYGVGGVDNKTFWDVAEDSGNPFSSWTTPTVYALMILDAVRRYSKHTALP